MTILTSLEPYSALLRVATGAVDRQGERYRLWVSSGCGVLRRLCVVLDIWFGLPKINSRTTYANDVVLTVA
jgi:hypothetical protein